jgi:transposase-like protein
MAHEVEKSPAMSASTTAISTGPAAATQDVLTTILQDDARQMLAQAVQAEVAAWIKEHARLKDQADRQQVVRNGYLPERTLLTGIGIVAVKQPRVHDCRPSGEREKLTAAILPPYLRRTKSLEELIPCLYLKGISTGDFSEALQALLGPDVPGLPAATITRLKAVWEQEYFEWRRRPLEGKRYVSVWADGVHFNIRLGRGPADALHEDLPLRVD